MSQYIRDLTHTYYLEMYRNNKIKKNEDVEDLTNTVFLAFAEQYLDIRNISYWLRRILFLTYVIYYKKNELKSSLRRVSSSEDSEARRPAAKMMYQNTFKVIALLGDEKQKLINLKFWANLDFSLIAKNLRKSESEVMKIFVRTLMTIRNRLR